MRSSRISSRQSRCRFGALAPLLLATTGTLLPLASQAAYIGTLAFIEPIATVGPNDTIPVWLRFTLDPASDPLVIDTDENGNPPFGIPGANVPQNFWVRYGDPVPQNLQSVTLTSLTRVQLNTWFGCDGVTFTTSCIQGPPYDFDFNTSGPDSINFLPETGTTFTMQPGETRDYLFGTFTPSAGPVAPGTYTFPRTGLTLDFDGFGTGEVLVLDENGDPIPVLDEFGDPVFDENDNPVYETETVDLTNISTTIQLGTTDGGAPFVRNVSAVPIPGAIWLFGSAIGIAPLLRRRRG